jgi:hypothetical protein
LLIATVAIVTVVSVGVGLTVAGAWSGMAQWITKDRRECGQVTTATIVSDITIGSVDDPKESVSFSHLVGDEFLGVGDLGTTRPVPRDVLDPPLRDGESVLFDDADDGPRDISRSNCGR